MPVLTDLDQRLRSPPFDFNVYEANLSGAQAVAERVHLLHVTGLLADAERWDVFLAVLNEPPHVLPTSADLVYCSDATRQAEDCLGFSRSIYFYAGRAHSSFGNIALAFAASIELGRTGSATPFDTGGFVWQPVPHIQVQLAPNDSLSERVLYCRQSELPLAKWREEFARVLAAYFDDLADYWTGRPARVDPERLYELNSDWRCWTFEIRLAEPQPIHDCAAWSADEDVMHRLFRLHASERHVPGAARPIDRFLNERQNLTPRGTPFYCRAVELWSREQLGI